jgi:hypothetical protein
MFRTCLVKYHVIRSKIRYAKRFSKKIWPPYCLKIPNITFCYFILTRSKLLFLDLNKISSVKLISAAEQHNQLAQNISYDDSIQDESNINANSITNNLSVSSTSSTQSATSQTKLTILPHQYHQVSTSKKFREDAVSREEYDGDYSFKSLKFNKDSSILNSHDIVPNGSGSNSTYENISLNIGKRLAMIQSDIIVANPLSPNVSNTDNNNNNNNNSNGAANRRSNSLNSISMLSINNLSMNASAENNGGVLTIATSTTNNNSYTNGIIVKDPVLIRGAGNITIFGVSNRFSEQFPTQLTAKLAPEEFKDTIKQINNILNKELANSLKWLVFGSIFCCCTLGCSLLPVIFMNKKARLSISKLLEMENQRLYLKLGLKWRLAKVKCNSNTLLEYVLLIEFLPTILLYQPD